MIFRVTHLTPLIIVTLLMAHACHKYCARLVLASIYFQAVCAIIHTC